MSEPRVRHYDERNFLPEVRHAKRITQEVLSKRSGVTVKTLSNIERGGRCTRTTKSKILKALRLSWIDVRSIWPDFSGAEPAPPTPRAPKYEPPAQGRPESSAVTKPAVAIDVSPEFAPGELAEDLRDRLLKEIRADRAWEAGAAAGEPEHPRATNGFDRHVDSVHRMLDAQAEKGAKHYPEDPARSALGPVYWLRQAQQELLDGAVYIDRAIWLIERQVAADQQLAAVRAILDRPLPSADRSPDDAGEEG